MRYSFLATRELNVCAKFQARRSKTVAATDRTDGMTDGQTDRRVKQEKPGVNQSTSPGSVLVSIQYRFVKQYSLVNNTGL